MAFLRHQLVAVGRARLSIVVGYLKLLLQYANPFYQQQVAREPLGDSRLLTAVERKLTPWGHWDHNAHYP